MELPNKCMCDCNWNFDRKYLDLRMEVFMLNRKTERLTFDEYYTINMYERYIKYLKMKCKCFMVI
jgi:hypothetical protein